MKSLHVLFVLFSVIVLTVTLSAQTIITVNVPVQLTGLHKDVEVVRARCFAYGQDGHTVVADAAAEIPCPENGNINQTVSAALKQIAGQDITLAVTVHAVLELKVDGVWQQPHQDTSTPVEYRAKEGTVFAGHVVKVIEW